MSGRHIYKYDWYDPFVFYTYRISTCVAKWRLHLPTFAPFGEAIERWQKGDALYTSASRVLEKKKGKKRKKERNEEVRTFKKVEN